MVNSEQIKSLSDRVDALRKYLDIDAKTMQLQEEELKTQVPDFWLDQKRAEEQMKKVKAIKRRNHSLLLITILESLNICISVQSY